MDIQKMLMGRSDGFLGSCYFSGSMVISGSIGLLVQNIDLSPLAIVFFRCLFGSLALLVYVFVFRREGFILSRPKFANVAICGVFLVLNWLALFAAFRSTSISVAVSIYYLAPVFTMLYGMARLGESRSTKKFLAIFLAFMGACLVSGINPNTSLESFAELRGVCYALLGAVFYFLVVVSAKRNMGVDASHCAFWQTFIGLVLLSFMVDFQDITSTGELSYASLITIGVVHTAIMYILFYKGIEKSRVSTVAMLGFLDPLVAVGVDVAIQQTELSLFQWIGIILLFGSIGMTTLSGSNKNPKERTIDGNPGYS